MAKLVEIGPNVFLNIDAIVSIDPEGSSSIVTLVTGKIRRVNVDVQQLAKKCTG